ncbi:MAG: hypothetical protein JNN16_19210 [Nitrospira sp.]|nr:hypothetical protein [Nitrospira sp.]MBS0165285.1 hypothetical protein [Nitrospira sp.]
MIMMRLLVVVLLGPLVLLSGCAVLGPKEEVPLKRVTVEDLTVLLRQRDAAVHSMKGLFSAKVRGGLIPILSRVEGTVYYRRPNALRLKGFTPFGGELFDFVQADEWYKLRLPLEGKVYTGDQADLKDQGSLARFSQLSAWAIGGLFGANALARDETAKLVLEKGLYRLDVYGVARGVGHSSRSLLRRLWFDRRLLVVQEDRLGEGGEIEATIHYDDFRPLDAGGAALSQTLADADTRLLRPFKISLEDGRGQGAVQVTFHELHQNQAITAEDLGQTL